jgi:serine O-acetyltransferase
MIFLEDLKQKAEWCYGRRDWRTLLKTCCTDGTAAMLWYRLMQGAQRRHLVPLAMLFNKINAVFCQCIIGRGADFGPGFVLIHSQGVMINGNVCGGSRVFIEHQVTIGAEKGRTPRVGDDVFIGAGAKIVGPVRIGSHARIGANAVVIHEVPDWATVGGIPARVRRVRDPRESIPDVSRESLIDGPSVPDSPPVEVHS